MKFYKDSLGVWWIGNRSYSGPITAIWNESKTHVRLVNNSSAIPFDTLLDADVADIQKENGDSYADFDELMAACSDFFVKALSDGGMIPVSVSIYIDGNRTDSYFQKGTIAKPFKTLSAAFASIIDLTKTYIINIISGSYVEEEALNTPAVPIVLYGNRSTITCPSITMNAPYSIYDLNMIGDVVYTYIGTTRSLRIGGSLVGNVSVSGFEDYKSVNFSAHTITVQGNSNPLFSHCTFGSKLRSAAATTTITVNDCSFSRPTVDDYNIDMSAGGNLVCKGALLENKPYASGGTHANINLSGASTTNPSLLSGCICGNGITAGNAYVIVGDDIVSPLITGTYIIPIKSPVIAFGIGGGTAQAQTATVAIVAYSYIPGMRFMYIPTQTNTAINPTINLNGLGAKTAYRGCGANPVASVVAGDILANVPCDCLYDGTYIRIMNPQTLS